MAPLLVSAYRAVSAAAPWLFARMAAKAHAAQGADAARLSERMGRATRPRPDGPLVWLHASSVGEVQSASAVAPALAEAATLLLTTTTRTGEAHARGLMGVGLLHQYQPIDTPRAVASFLDHWQPDLAVFTENEMPPNALHALRQRGIASALIGARPSGSRAKRPKSSAYLLSLFDVVTASSEDVAAELRTLGAAPAAVEDLKRASFAGRAVAPPDWPADQLARPIWLAASTHDEDLPVVFDAHRKLLAERPDALLLLAPRHPSDDRSFLPAGLNAAFYSDGAPPSSEVQVFVMDAIGQMPALHAAASVCFMGGSFGAHGGHSPWEAAAAGNHLITGPDIANNAPAFAALAHQVVQSAGELAGAALGALAASSAPKHFENATQGKTLAAMLQHLVPPRL